MRVELTEAYVLFEIRACFIEERIDQQRLNRIVSRLYEDLYSTWIPTPRSSIADAHMKDSAFNQAVMQFVENVKRGQYVEGNWRGYIITIANRRWLDQINKTTKRGQTENPTDDFSLLASAHAAESTPFLDAAFVKKFFEDADLNDNQRTVISLLLEGYSYEEMNKKTRRSPDSLRQDVSSGLFRLREYLLTQRYKHKAGLSFCKESCKKLVFSRLLEKLSYDKIARENPGLSRDNFPKPQKTWEAQYKTCVNCLVKKCRDLY